MDAPKLLFSPDLVFCCLPCADQTNIRPSRARLGQGALGSGNGDHRAEASVSAVPMFACCPTPWPGSTTCQTPTGERGRWGRGSVTVPVGLRSKSTSTHLPTPPSGEEGLLLCSFCLCLSSKSIYSCYKYQTKNSQHFEYFFLSCFCCVHQRGILQQPCHRFPPYLFSGPPSRPNTHHQRPSRYRKRTPHRVPNSPLRCHRLPRSPLCRRPGLLRMPPSLRRSRHDSRLPPPRCRD